MTSIPMTAALLSVLGSKVSSKKVMPEEEKYALKRGSRPIMEAHGGIGVEG
jgi:hypothetical protein